MSHLVSPLRDLSLSDGLRALRQAHDFLVERTTAGLDAKFDRTAASGSKWGIHFKRIGVDLPLDNPGRVFIDSEDRVLTLVEPSVQSQKLVELVNQLATIERLVDALTWAMSEGSGLARHRIKLCHPTTSSDPQEGTDDHDLVLSGPNDESA